jgi:tetratricopeptide (TPR) repeat protein
MIAGRENWDGRGVNGWRGNAWRNGYYAGFHNGWVHGYWAGAATGWGGWGWGYPGIGLGFGYGLGTGLAFWSMGSALYNTAGGWGYMPYYNPYYYGPVVAASAPVYDYSAPIDTMAAAPDEAVAQPAVSTFDQARAAFQAGNYDQALQLTDQALKALPADETIHEFRAQVLFALGRYDEAAATLYSVLAVGPGWDWSTLVGLYPSVDVFTQKQRALEDAVRQNPDSAAGRFVLAYLYLAQGHNDAAIQELERVTQIQPKDRVSAQILASLQKGKAATATAAADTNAAAAPAAEQPAPAATPDVRGTLGGAYTAKAEPQGSITLTIGPEDAFVWKVASGSQSHDLKGKYTYGDGVLTLVPDGGGAPLVGRLTWSDPKAFTFQAMGGGPGDPGLAFQAAP